MPLIYQSHYVSMKFIQHFWKYVIQKNQILTHWGRDKMDAISQRTFPRAFSLMLFVVFWLYFHWNIFARVKLTIKSAMVQLMAWRRSGDKPLSEPMMVSLLTHICVTRPQWVNKPTICVHRLAFHFDVHDFIFIFHCLPIYQWSCVLSLKKTQNWCILTEKIHVYQSIFNDGMR